MRRAMLLVISVMPLLAQAARGPVTAQISNASVLFGPGIIQDQSGQTAPPKFETKLSGEVRLGGLASRVHPRFRFWLVKAGDEEKLKRSSPGALKGKALAGNSGIKTEAGYAFDIHWIKGTVDPEDRLFIEVFLGRRRAATAISAIQSHYLPASRPNSGVVND